MGAYQFLISLSATKVDLLNQPYLLQHLIWIQLFQYLALLFPIDHWRITEYKETNTKLILSIFRLSIVDIDGYHIYLAIIYFILNLTILMLVLRCIISSHSDSLKAILLYFSLLNEVLLAPQIVGISSNLNSNFSNYGLSSLCFITLIMLILQSGLSMYLIQNYEISPHNILARRITVASLVFKIIQFICYYLHTYETNDFTLYVKYSSYIIFCLIQSFDSYINQQGMLQFQCTCFKLGAIICLGITISYDNTIFQDDMLLLILLIIGILMFHCGRRLYINHIQSLINKESDIKFIIQYIRSLEIERKQHSFSTAQIKFHQYLRGHYNKCIDCQGNYKQYEQYNSKQYIYCLLNNRKNILNEEMQLIYIDFLNVYCKQPMLSYMKLRQYEREQNNISLFYSIVSQNILQTLQKQITILQNENQPTNDEGELMVDSILTFFDIYQETLQRVIRILDLKTNIWINQIKGFTTIYEFRKKVTLLSGQIQDFSNYLTQKTLIDVEKTTHLNTVKNALILKLLSLYYAGVMNDYHNVFICENQIQLLLNQEQSNSSDMISFSAVFDDRLIQLSVSLVKSMGLILNKNKTEVGQMFGLESKEEQDLLTNINQLMPNFVGNIHNKIVQNYLSNGKSNFFQQFRQIFGLHKNGFIFPIYMKFSNDFSAKDDYIIQATIFQNDQNNDYILFDESGKILGITKQLYRDLLESCAYDISLRDITDKYYIYYFIPNIVKVLMNFQDSQKQEQMIQSSEEDAIFVSRTNLKEFVQYFGQLNIQKQLNLQQSLTSRKIDTQNSVATQSVAQKKQINLQRNLMTVVSLRSEFSKSISMNNCDLINQELDDQLKNIFSEFGNKDAILFELKFALFYWQFGKSEYQKNIFIMEVMDYRRTDAGYTTTVSSGPLYPTIQTSLRNNGTQNSDQQQQSSNYTVKAEIPAVIVKQHIIPNVRLIKVDESQDVSQLHQSASVGPFYKLPLFNQAIVQEMDEEMLQIDQDMIDLQGILSVRNSAREMILKEDDIDNPLSSSHQRVMQASNSNKEKSNRISEKFKQFRQTGLQQEGDFNRSKSSNTSKTSGTSASDIIRQFEQTKTPSFNLSCILLLKILIMALLFALMFVHSSQLATMHNTTITNNNMINGPLTYNRYYSKATAQAWIIATSAVNILNCSEYMISQTIKEQEYLSTVVFNNIRDLYSTFVDLEKRGLLDRQTLDMVFSVTSDSSYTHFSSILQNQLVDIFEVKKLKPSEISQVLNRDYLDSMIIIRRNLVQIYNINTNLMDSLSLIFLQDLQSQTDSVLVQIIFEIAAFGALLYMQLYFWQKLESHNQAVLILDCKMQEQNALELTARANYLKQCAQCFCGKGNWKRQDYYNLLLTNINQQEEMNLVQKITKGRMKQTILSSRIGNTKISLLLPMILLSICFIIIALYLLGVFLLFNKQSQDILPQQQLALNFIKFNSKLDLVIASALILKTQDQFYKILQDLDIYTPELIVKIKGTRLRLLFQQLAVDFASQIIDIFQGIVLSTKIHTADAQKLYSLYQHDFCNLLKAELSFCNLANEQDFIQQYGQYYPRDNNRDYVSNGIIGVVSRVQSLLKQNYDAEINTNSSSNSTYTEWQALLNSKEFDNALLSHFRDVYKGMLLFLDTLNNSTRSIMESNLMTLRLYIFLIGIVLIILFFILTITWIRSALSVLKKVRLSLVLLPLDIQTSAQTLSVLRRLSY